MCADVVENGDDDFKIDRIAIIGAGAAGLAAATYISGEQQFSHIEVFEQRSSAGGTWNYSSAKRVPGLAVPKTTPDHNNETPSQPTSVDDDGFVSPLYRDLDTNIPHNLMNFSNKPFPEGSSLFPSRDVVTEYLHQYAESLKHMIHYNTQVRKITKINMGEKEFWNLDTENLKSHETGTSFFDAVVIANGHYSDVHIPDITGIKEFHQRYPEIISHSKYYEKPENFEDKKVIVVGFSASGLDISMQIAQSCRHPVLVSEKTPSLLDPSETGPNLRMMPTIEEFLVDKRAVRFSNGHVETDVDSVIFCTGYLYSFPFLESLRQSLTPDGSYVRHLYQHLFFIDDPTLAFVALPKRIVPFPVSESQSAYIARVWANRAKLPANPVMREWEASLVASCPEPSSLHDMKYPKDADYINKLHEICKATANGVNLIPPRWDEEACYYREHMAQIKSISRKLGHSRRLVKSLSELGFEYPVNQSKA
ncbi:dimethylaniline monooxygenase, putative [Talaromyces stipitatus ATCC 10500]|uniref:Dimethylaniline monooxygenase, putative n=1 Tax=Talaromyces stipitatus (strain ATCC 10500 / CBS 375.48 / QM 6759 / NRRL 1006) TaxID=441959 RepID=B8MFM7_TALSN|nr:dimethylaniline monooxygenase, putative [Talaromyces stipitatus ATCC 10500]EED17017.1 dimethylaniline monooxygenase, putative [Talaromyces stipitatus ATCC 10500]